MTSRLNYLQVLRQERRPLVALASLAFVMRLCLLVLASALTPQVAAAAGLTSLCQPSALEQGLPSAHDPLSCQCGPVCAHGCTLGPCLHTATPVQETLRATATVPAFRVNSVLRFPGSERIKAIRAPPFS